MSYANFSRHLREKYWTRLHIADQIIDQLKSNNQSRTLLTSSDRLMNKTMLKAQQEISYPLIAYLNEFDYDEQNTIEYKKKDLKPYFNECILAAERLKNNRRSHRDRQICYENFILAKKLERIKNQTVHRNPDTVIKRPSMKKHSLSTDEKNSSGEKSSKIVIPSFQSSSDAEDDQATAADVDGNMDFYDSTSSILYHQQNARHFSICILPRFETNPSKIARADRPRAFKKEILYHRMAQ